MAEAQNNTPQEQGRSAFTLIWKLIKWVFGIALAIILSWLFSVLIEVVGLTFFWEDEGAKRSKVILAQEIKYIQNKQFKSAFMDDQSVVVVDRAVKAYSEINKKTKLDSALKTMGEYGEAIKNVTLIFLIRLAVISSILILYIFITIWSFGEGLLLRARRKWTGGVERSFVYHHVKSTLYWVIVLPIPIYLMIPFAIHPMTITAPFMALYSILLICSVGFFKKIL